jgi:hypothetical protein
VQQELRHEIGTVLRVDIGPCAEEEPANTLCPFHINSCIVAKGGRLRPPLAVSSRGVRLDSETVVDRAS